MPWTERAAIVENLAVVDHVIDFNDDDGSATAAILKAKLMFPGEQIIFANGGDRTAKNIPEMEVKDVIFKFGVGGEDKANSSSWILQEWKAPKTERVWGYYRVLHEVGGCKVKELTVEPGQSLSMQRHFKRNEYWLVTHGMCVVNSQMAGGYALPPTLLKEHMEYRIAVGEWHQLVNPYNIPCKIVEIQYGESCTEEDIERKPVDGQ